MGLAGEGAALGVRRLGRYEVLVRSLANLEHDSFVRFGELACEDGQWFFTMERIYGTDFLRYVDIGRGAPGNPGHGPVSLRIELASAQARRRRETREANRYGTMAVEAYRHWGATAKAAGG